MAMDKVSRSLALLLIVVIGAVSMLAIQPTFAQSIPQPSAPQFTVKFVDRSYDVPNTYRTTTDPFTGKQVTANYGGYHVTNKTVDITIKNRPYSSINLQNGNLVQLYYAVRTKGHFTDWSPEASGGYSFTRVLSSTTGDTVVTLRIGSCDNDILMDYADVVISEAGQEDFQVNAQAGYEYPYSGGHILPLGIEFALLAESGWSGTQTVSFSNDQVSNSNPLIPTPTVPELPWLALLPLCLIALSIALVSKRLKATQP
jgi:hypothetical protein